MTPEIDFGGAISGAAVGAGGLVGALLYVRRQLSRDKTAIAEDVSARGQLTRLEGEIARLTAALDKAHSDVGSVSAQRTADAQRIASLQAENGYVQRENARLLRDIKRAVRSLPDDIRDVLETDFSALADVEERIERR